MSGYIACIIAGLSFGLSVFVFLFDLKIKRQQKEINEYKIKQINEIEAEQHKAILTVRTTRQDKGSIILEISNSGASDAHNIFIKDLNNESFLLQDIISNFPFDLTSGDTEMFTIYDYCDMPEKAIVMLSWNDDNGNHSEKRIINVA